MNDLLNTEKLQYDSPRYSEMEYFLNHILTIAKYNPNYPITDDLIYGQLERFGLMRKDFNGLGHPKSAEPLFQKWISRFKSIPNISVYNAEHWKYWCQFVNKSNQDEFIKVYVPIDAKGLEEGVNELFDFLAKYDIHHQSKVGKSLRNDNVVIRLDKGDEKSLRMLINYINSNPKIRNHLNKTNPFLPNINGIGVMNETGKSYNSKICKIMSQYISMHRNDKSINVSDFLEFAKANIYEKEFAIALDNAINNKPHYFDAHEKVDGLIENETKLTDIQKCALLNDTITATYEKYGMRQVTVALMKVLSANDYSYFTNGHVGYRDFLQKNVKKEEIYKIIEASIKNIYRKQYTNIKDMVDDYCKYYLSDGLVSKLDEMCAVTLENYSAEFLRGSINEYCISGKTTCFSRFKRGDTSGINYRYNCKYILPENILIAIRKSLRAKGVDTSYISNNELSSLYVQKLVESKYEIKLEEDSDMKIYR